jgi:hypothetical protein
MRARTNPKVILLHVQPISQQLHGVWAPEAVALHVDVLPKVLLDLRPAHVAERCRCAQHLRGRRCRTREVERV